MKNNKQKTLVLTSVAVVAGLGVGVYFGFVADKQQAPLDTEVDEVVVENKTKEQEKIYTAERSLQGMRYYRPDGSVRMEEWLKQDGEIDVRYTFNTDGTGIEEWYTETGELKYKGELRTDIIEHLFTTTITI